MWWLCLVVDLFVWDLDRRKRVMMRKMSLRMHNFDQIQKKMMKWQTEEAADWILSGCYYNFARCFLMFEVHLRWFVAGIQAVG